jgi:NAD(P)-dependent dehydrogenase (short-subunit alcohol dehydrogenase family)
MAHELAGKNFIVTGGNSGIGMVAARELAQRGARVIIASRSADKTLPVIEDIKRATGNDQVEFAKLDLSDLDSVRACGEALLAKGITFDVLINNAGFASGVRGARGLTKQGFELTFGTNHLGHYLLTRQLLDRITGRVVNVSSVSHYQTRSWQWERLRQPTRSFAGLGEYAISKLANVLFTEELAKRWSGKTYAVHPGTVATDVWRRVPGPVRWVMKKFMVTPEEGAQTSIRCATAPELASETGRYYDRDGKERKPNRLANDEALAKQLWTKSAEWTGLPA